MTFKDEIYKFILNSVVINQRNSRYWNFKIYCNKIHRELLYQQFSNDSYTLIDQINDDIGDYVGLEYNDIVPYIYDFFVKDKFYLNKDAVDIVILNIAVYGYYKIIKNNKNDD